MRRLNTFLLVLVFVPASYAQETDQRLTSAKDSFSGVQDTEVIEPESKPLAIDERPDQRSIAAVMAVKEGNRLWRKEKFRHAATSYQQAIDLDAELYAAQYNLGAAHLRLQQYSDAVDAFKTAISLKPGCAQAWQGLGLTQYYQRQ